MKRIASILSVLIVLAALAVASPAQIPIKPVPPGQVVAQETAPLFEVIYTFVPSPITGGYNPTAALIQGTDGTLYGTTPQG